MSEHRVLIAMPLAHEYVDQYRDRFRAHGIEYEVPNVDGSFTEDQLREIIGRYDGVLTGFVGLSRETIAAAKRLDVISQWGIGLDGIDLEAAEDHGIAVYNTPGAFAEEIADVVIGYLIVLTRELHQVDRAVRGGNWPSPSGTSLRGRTLGIAGVGSIGEAVARRAHAHGMDLLGADIDPLDEELKRETSIERVSQEELFAESFAVSLNCPLTPATRNMVGRDELDRLGPEGYLINTARGEVVQEDELISALRDGRLAGAALDVFETEPLPADSPLTTMENVVLGAHNAGHTEAAVEATTERAIENLIEGVTSQADGAQR